MTPSTTNSIQTAPRAAAHLGSDPSIGSPPIVRSAFRTGTWASAATLVLIAAVGARTVATNQNIHWQTVRHYLFHPLILQGLINTVLLTAICMVIGTALGIPLALMRRSTNPVARGVAGAYLWVFRGTPLLVQLLFWYNIAALFPHYSVGIPYIAPHLLAGSINDVITPYVAASLGLGLNEAAYMTEIIRAGLGSVDHGQTEAARSVGMRSSQILWRVIFPQALPVIIPPAANEAIGALKTTSLVSVIALGDLLYAAQTIYSRTFQTIPLLIVACIWYLAATTILSFLQSLVERHSARRRGLGKGPVR